MAEGLKRVAVIDVGSNSVLALVAEREGDGPWRRVWEECTITSLGDRLVPGGNLLSEAMKRTAEAVWRVHHASTVHGADAIAVVGTMAVRTAANRDEFLRLLRREGVSLRVLDEQDEAWLSYLSVARDPAFGADGLVVIDIGGASVELATAEHARSLDIGTIRVSREILGPGPCDDASIFQASAAIDRLLEEAEPSRPVEHAVTVGATGVNLACIRRGLAEHDPDAVHGDELEYEYISETAAMLARLSDEDRQALPGTEAGRGPVMHGAALILERCMNWLGVDSVGVSNRGLRWGLLEEM
jgi:exopolyphosphatase/guanosine-5'-triphosphate,3'-diphosphate pyrophosphatase